MLAPREMNTLTFRGLLNFADQLTLPVILKNWKYVRALTGKKIIFLCFESMMPISLKKEMFRLINRK